MFSNFFNRFTANTETFLVFLFSLLILFNYLGRGVYNTTLGLVSILAFFIFFKNKFFFELFKDKILIYFLIFAFSTVITIPFSLDFFVSFKNYLYFLSASLISIIIGLYLFVYSDCKEKNLIMGLHLMFFTSIVMEIITITGMYFDIQPIKYIVSFGEVKIPMNNRYHLAEIFTAAIIPLGIFLYYLKPSKLKIIFLTISFVGILASTSRTAILASLFSVVLFILIKNKWKIFNKEFIMFFLIIAISSLIAFEVSPKIQERVQSFKTTFGLDGGDMMSGRLHIYQETIKRIMESPIVGHGIKNTTINNFILTYHGGKEIVKHSHNIWLEILHDTGIIGFLTFLIFLSLFLKKVFIKFKDKSSIHRATIWATLTSIFLSSLASWSIWSGNQIGSIWLIIILTYSIYSVDIKSKM